MSNWKVGDWIIFDLGIYQIKEIRDASSASVSDGSFETSGNLADRFRPLTLRNKAIVESFDWHYMELRKIRGERGFNYPDINRYFCDLAREAIDDEANTGAAAEKVRGFVRAAREYQPVIDGVHLFRE